MAKCLQRLPLAHVAGRTPLPGAEPTRYYLASAAFPGDGLQPLLAGDNTLGRALCRAPDTRVPRRAAVVRLPGGERAGDPPVLECASAKGCSVRLRGEAAPRCLKRGQRVELSPGGGDTVQLTAGRLAAYEWTVVAVRAPLGADDSLRPSQIPASERCAAARDAEHIPSASPQELARQNCALRDEVARLTEASRELGGRMTQMDNLQVELEARAAEAEGRAADLASENEALRSEKRRLERSLKEAQEAAAAAAAASPDSKRRRCEAPDSPCVIAPSQPTQPGSTAPPGCLSAAADAETPPRGDQPGLLAGLLAGLEAPPSGRVSSSSRMLPQYPQLQAGDSGGWRRRVTRAEFEGNCPPPALPTSALGQARSRDPMPLRAPVAHEGPSTSAPQSLEVEESQVVYWGGS